MLPFNKKLKPFARNLRINMTDAEQLIWSKIRRKRIGDLQFYRQKNIGHYIMDFYCPQGKLREISIYRLISVKTSPVV